MGQRSIGGGSGIGMAVALGEAQKGTIEAHKNSGVEHQGPAVRYAGGVNEPAAQARADAGQAKLLANRKSDTFNEQRQDDLVQFAKDEGNATTGMTINSFRQIGSDVLNDPTNGMDAATAAAASILENAIDRTAILMQSDSASLDGHANDLKAGTGSKLGGSGT